MNTSNASTTGQGTGNAPAEDLSRERPVAVAPQAAGSSPSLVVLVVAWILVLRSGQRCGRPALQDRAGHDRARWWSRCPPPATCSRPTRSTSAASSPASSTEVLVDENDRVKKGQVLARLDLVQAQGRGREVARDARRRPRRRCCRRRPPWTRRARTLARYQQVAELSGGKVPSQSEMDTAEANAEARRGRRGQRAARRHAGAGQPAARTRPTSSKASIRSPIDGVVLTRKVEPGQTVAASFQAPVLFTLAEDLAKMELQVDVDEADVGQVQGRPAGHVHGRRLARPQVPGRHHARRLRLAGEGRRGLLPDRARGRQRRPEPAPRHDRHRRDHHA